MAKSQRLRAHDLVRIYRLIGDCRDLGYDAQAWRSQLLEGLRRTVGAYVGVAGEIVGYLSSNQDNQVIVQLFSFGWNDPERAKRWQQFVDEEAPCSDPIFERLLAQVKCHPPLVTRAREHLVRDREWYKSPHFNNYRRPGRVDHCLYSYLRLPALGPDVIHILELHRAAGDQRFNERELNMLDYLHSELGPLIGRQLASGREPSASDLSPRVRQVLQCLLEGDAEKQVALRLGISAYTVHEYVEEIYRHFRVNSRGELMARWIRFAPVDGEQQAGGPRQDG